jgi:hypothetical protein
MKTFTKLLLAVGVIALVLYAIPLESFTSDSTTPNMNLQAIIDHWKQLSPEEKDRLRGEARSLRGRIGLADAGVFANGRIQEPPTPSVSTPDSDPAPVSAPSGSNETKSAYMNAFGFSPEKKAIVAPPTAYPAVTRSDVQGLINDSIKDQIKQQLQSQNSLSLVSARNLDNRRDDAQVIEDRKQHIRQLKQDKRREQQKQIGEKQIVYVPQRCPSTTPDPNVWIKRDEIPCWACKP